MQIGIDLVNYQTPIEEWDNIVSAYGKEREIGYLKINPERIPVIVSESKARKPTPKKKDKTRQNRMVTRFFIKNKCYSW